MAQNWKYVVVVMDEDAEGNSFVEGNGTRVVGVSNILNWYGGAGWELVSFQWRPLAWVDGFKGFSGNDRTRAVFKRPVE